MSKRIIVPILLACVFLLRPASGVLAAGSAKLLLVPSSGSYALNSTLTLAIHEDSGATTVNAVEADLSYDQSQLQYVGYDTSTSPFDNGLNPTGGAGIVKFSRAKNGAPLTGDQVIGTVTFKALVGSGTTSITFAGTSYLIHPVDSTSGQDVWDHNTAGGTYTLTGASTSPSPSPTPTPTPTPNPSSSTTTKTTTNSSTTKKTTSSSSNTTQPTTPATTSTLEPTTMVGYYVAIKVTDSNKKPVLGATVTIDGQEPMSYDNTGLASFSSVTAGEHTVSVSAKGKKTTKTITVAASAPSEVQEFDVSLKTGMNSTVRILLYIGAIVLLILLLGGGSGLLGMLIKQRRTAKFYAQRTADVKPVEQPVVGAIPDQPGKSAGVVVGSFEQETANKTNQPKP